jgi:predicted nucleic-acid-binding Zn-ribbon protein
MKLTGTCPKCGSKDVAANAEFHSRFQGSFDAMKEHNIVIYRDKRAGLFSRGKKKSRVTAWVCRNCGFIEFYAETPTDLRGE